MREVLHISMSNSILLKAQGKKNTNILLGLFKVLLKENKALREPILYFKKKKKRKIRNHPPQEKTVLRKNIQTT